MHRLQFRWRTFGIAASAVLLLHWFVMPRILLPLIERKEAAVEVEYVSLDEPVADDKAEPAKLDDQRPEPKDEQKPEPEKDKPEELAKLEKQPEPPKPEETKPELVQPPPPPTPPPPPPELIPHQRMVDQDQFPDEQDNADAKYLAQKNHRAKQDTRTNNTNLVRNQQGPVEASAPSDKKPLAEHPGGPDQKRAELQQRPGRKDQVVRGQPHRGDEGKADRTTPGKLSMRGLTPRSVENKPAEKPREGPELSDKEPGSLPMARQGSEGERAGSQARGAKRPNLSLSPLDYDKIVGESVAESERRQAARAEVSRAPGRWEKLQKKLAMMRSSLENFTPDSHVGNEAELGTRAHPFAAYIATMHRSIHRFWGDGFLPTLDSKGALDPLNDMERYTLIGIVLSADGVVEKVTINRPSGYAPFDVAAMDAVVSASPFPSPPESIKSADGKVYLDWTFHRDDRQCATDGVYPHILEHPPGERGPTGAPPAEKHTALPARPLRLASAR